MLYPSIIESLRRKIQNPAVVLSFHLGSKEWEAAAFVRNNQIKFSQDFR